MKNYSVTFDASRISVQAEFRAPPEKAWALLTDTTRWEQWGPTVQQVNCPDRYIRKGSEGTICTPIGVCLPFQITDYENGHYWAWKVGGIRATAHRLIPIEPATCRIAFEMPGYWLPYIIVCRTALKRMAGILES